MASPDAYKEYYSSFEEAYRRRLDEAVEAGEIEPGNNKIRSWTLIGANVFLGMRFGLWDDDFTVEEIGKEFEHLITKGLLTK